MGHKPYHYSGYLGGVPIFFLPVQYPFPNSDFLLETSPTPLYPFDLVGNSLQRVSPINPWDGFWPGVWPINLT